MLGKILGYTYTTNPEWINRSNVNVLAKTIRKQYEEVQIKQKLQEWIFVQRLLRMFHGEAKTWARY